MLEKILRRIKTMIPAGLFRFFQPAYHYSLALAAALWYRFPSKHIHVIGVTGTKGKTSVIELINAILEEAGFKTALSSTLRFKVAERSERNLHKMTMPGRFFMQRFIRKAVKEKCKYVILEMTSEGVKFYRHRFIALDALVFTNLSPEHIESHGSYEKYLEAKLAIARSLEKSGKKRRIIVANADDKESPKFLIIDVEEKQEFSLADAKPYTLRQEGLEMTFEKEEIRSHLSGKFNIYNILAAATYAKTQNVSTETIKRAIEKFTGIRGRVEKIDEGQDFTIVVDYAHTPDSLEKLYEVFENSKNICVLGNTGGGRDKWKRKEMAEIAAKYCEHIILTNEDPYDENPRAIVDQMARAIKKPIYKIIMDRRAAILEALKTARTGDSVLITGKGTDPYIMGPKGEKTPWDDAQVAREELKKILSY